MNRIKFKIEPHKQHIIEPHMLNLVQHWQRYMIQSKVLSIKVILITIVSYNVENQCYVVVCYL